MWNELNIRKVNDLDLSRRPNYKYIKVLYRAGYKIQVSELIEMQSSINSAIVNSLSILFSPLSILEGLIVSRTQIVDSKQNFSISPGVVLINKDQLKLLLNIPNIWFSLPLTAVNDYKWDLTLSIREELIDSEIMYLSRNITIVPSKSYVVKYSPYIGIENNVSNFIFCSIKKKENTFEIIDHTNKQSSLSINPSTRRLPKTVVDTIKYSHPTESSKSIIEGLLLKKISDSSIKITPGTCYIKGERVSLGIGKIINLNDLSIPNDSYRIICLSPIGIVIKGVSIIDKVNTLVPINSETITSGHYIANDSSYHFIELGKIYKKSVNDYEIYNINNRLPHYRLKDLEDRLSFLRYQISDLQVYADNISVNPGSLSIGSSISESNIRSLTDESDKGNNFSYDSANESISLPVRNTILPLSNIYSSSFNITPSIYNDTSKSSLFKTFQNGVTGIYETVQKSIISLIYTNPWYLPDDISSIDEDVSITIVCIGFKPLERILSVNLGSIGLGIISIDYGNRESNSYFIASPTGCIKLSCRIPQGTDLSINRLLTVQGVSTSISKLLVPSYDQILNLENPFDINVKNNLITQSFTPDVKSLLTSVRLNIKYMGLELTKGSFSRSPSLLVLVSKNKGIEPDLGRNNPVSIGILSSGELLKSEGDKQVSIRLLNPYHVEKGELNNITIIPLTDGIGIKYIDYYNANNSSYQQGTLSKMVISGLWEEEHIKDIMIEFEGILSPDGSYSFSNNLNLDTLISSIEIYPESQEISSNANINVLSTKNQSYNKNLELSSSTSTLEINWVINSPLYSLDLSRYIYIGKKAESEGRWISAPILISSVPKRFISVILAISNNSSSGIKVYTSLDNKSSWIQLEISNVVPNRTQSLDASFYRQEWTLSINNLSLINQVKNINSFIVRIDLSSTGTNIGGNTPHIKDISIFME